MTTDLFFGRVKEQRTLKHGVFSIDNVDCCSIIGPNNVGKTYLVHHMLEQMRRDPPANTYCFQVAPADSDTFWRFWATRILEFQMKLPREVLLTAPNPSQTIIDKIISIYEFVANNLENCESLPFGLRMNAYLNDLFLYYTALGLRIILIIDEFDRARTVFDTGDFFQRLFDLSRKGSLKPNLSIITLSRRHVSTIAHHMNAGSNFADAFPAIPLRGFSNAELEEYFQSYAHLPCGIPEGPQRQAILYLCGRNPGLLMQMRDKLAMLEPGEPVDIAKIYQEEDADFIRAAYGRMCSLMESEFVDKAKTRSCMSIFHQFFLGPAYSPDLVDKLAVLYNYGFITKSPASESIFALAGLEPPSTDSSTIYEPLSPYFLEYLRCHISSDSLGELSDKLAKTELAVRQAILTGLRRHYPDSWEDILSAASPRKDPFLESLQRQALANDFKGTELSKLNVLSFSDYFFLLRQHWESLKDSFPAYWSDANLQPLHDDFFFLSSCRNCSAHLNLEILNRDNADKLLQICNKLLRGIDGASAAPAPAAPAAPTPPAPEPEVPAPAAAPQTDAPEEDIPDLIGHTVDMQVVKVTNINGLRGVMAQSDISLSISRKQIKAQNISPQSLINHTIRVQVLSWDKNGKTFNCVFTD